MNETKSTSLVSPAGVDWYSAPATPTRLDDLCACKHPIWCHDIVEAPEAFISRAAYEENRRRFPPGCTQCPCDLQHLEWWAQQ